MNILDNFVTPSKLAARIGITNESIRRWIKQGFVKGVKFGGRYKIPQEEAERIIDLLNANPSSPEVVLKDFLASEGKDKFITNSSRLGGNQQ